MRTVSPISSRRFFSAMRLSDVKGRLVKISNRRRTMREKFVEQRHPLGRRALEVRGIGQRPRRVDELLAEVRGRPGPAVCRRGR